MKKVRYLILLVMLLALVLSLKAVCAETVSFNNLKAALNYVRQNQPSEITLEKVKFKPPELLQIKNALPEGAAFHFTTTWGSVTFSDDATDLDLRTRKAGVSAEDLEAIVQICPDIKRIDNSNKRAPSNKQMIPLIEKYPDVQFEWMVYLGKGHYISTTVTAYSTFNHSSYGSNKKLTAEDLELLKYCPRLKALDLGHNRVQNLEFLKYLPDLELLIIGDNQVADLTPVGQLKHLQYAELFMNRYSDVSPLANCTELLDLNLTVSKITDLSPLDQVTSLERLWVNSCKELPKEAVDHFKETHPDCLVDYKPSSGAMRDGWREHPRYKHYIWCLKHSTWIPFDEEIPSR